MRKQAFHCLVFALSAEIALTLFHIVTKNWLRTISDPGLIGTVIGWGISIAIILYSKRLTERNILE